MADFAAMMGSVKVIPVLTIADAADAIPLADWVVVVRPGTDLPDHRLAAVLTRLDVPRLEVSSTALRARVAAGQSIRFLVPDPVIAEVARRVLYRPSDD